jgi:hypothetical protein
MENDFDPVSFIDGQRRQAQSVAVAALDGDPDEAARAVELGKATNIPAPVISLDVPAFEAQHKAALTSQLLQNNDYLRQYINSDPMAIKVSHDDLAQMDAATEAAKAYTSDTRLEAWLKKSFSPTEAFMKGFGDQPVSPEALGKFYGQYTRPSDIDFAINHPAQAAVMQPLTTAIGLGELGMEGMSRITNGLIEMGHEGISQIFGKSFADEMAGLAQYSMMRGDIIQPEGVGGLGPEAIKTGNVQLLKQMHEGLQIADHYDGKPPIGVHPLIDEAHKLQAKEDGKTLGDLTSASAKMATQERSPDMAAQFWRQKFGDQEIGINAEAIRKLYGDKIPESDDNILGWVPDLQAKLEAAEAVGGDIHVPIADWLARVDPEVEKTLHDDLRARPGGFTINETKPPESIKSAAVKVGDQIFEGPLHSDAYEAASKALGREVENTGEGGFVTSEGRYIGRQEALKVAQGALQDSRIGKRSKFEEKDRELLAEEVTKPPEPKTSIADPLQLIRGEAGFEPQFSIGDRKLTIQRKALGEVKDPDVIAPDQFDVLDETGKKVGNVEITPFDNGQKLYVDMINGINGHGPQAFGPGLMKDIARQLKQEYPNSTHIGGYRVSGAREKAGTERDVWVRFDERNFQGMQDTLHGVWEQHPYGTEALKPYSPSLEYDKLTQAIQKEADRLGLQKVTVETAAQLKPGRGRPGDIGGQYQKSPVDWPRILVALDKPEEALGVLQHEAIHHLRAYGFFNDKEWASLEAAAKSEDWQKKYLTNKDGSPRYKGLAAPKLIEESIAEAFRNWKAGQEMPEGIHAIFEKLKAFLESIKTSFKELAGKDLNWEEIFKKIDTGEIGGREGTEARVEGGVRPFDPQAMARPPRPEPGKLVRREEPGGVKIYDTHDWKLVSPGSFGGEWKLVINETKIARNIDETYAKQIMKAWNESPAKAAELVNIPIKESKGVGDDFTPLHMERETDGLFEKGKALGVTQAHMDRMLKLARERGERDLAKAEARATKQQTRSQTKEWRERRTTIRDEVREQLSGRPDLATDELFAKGDIKLHPDNLTEIQKAALPKDYIQKKNGVNPDDIAGHFGYTSGDALVERLGMLTEDRRRSNMSQRDYFNRLVDVETDRRLNQEFGDLGERIMDEARDQALSESQINLVHEETQAYAMAAGVEPRFTHQQVKDMVKQQFDTVPTGQISSKRLIQTTGRLGKKIEEAGAKGDWVEAYRLSQQRQYATLATRYALDFEKAKAKFDREAKTMGKAEVPSVEPEYLNFIKNIYQQLGYEGQRRSARNVRENIERRGQTLQEFADAKLAESWGARQIPVPDMLQDPAFKADPKDLTVDQFNQINATMTALIKNGRNEQKIIREGETEDLKDVVNRANTQLQTFTPKDIPSDYKPGFTAKAIAGSTAVPTLMNRWDRFDPRGLFHKYVVYPLARADNGAARMEREITKPMSVVYDVKGLDKTMDVPPELKGWKYTTFTHDNFLNLIQHMGNEGNWRVAAEGWGADKEVLRQWVIKNATKEMFDRAQKIGDTIFGDLVKKADQVEEEVNGHTIDKIKLTPFEVQFPDGTKVTYPGWYHPLVPDPLWVGKQKVRGGPQEGGFGIATASGYRQSRTGAVYPLDLSFSTIPLRVKQMIHDINYRIPVMEVQKLFKDPSFSNTVTKHYGPDYNPKNFLLPFLQDMAGRVETNDAVWKKFGQVSDDIRQNVIGTYIGFNLGTIAKHAPTAAVMSLRALGPSRFLDAYGKIWGQGEHMGESWSKFIDNRSEEIQRRERNWEETIAGQTKKLYSEGTGREKVLQWGSWGVAQSDKFSAKPLWLGTYLKAFEENPDIGEATDIADRAVRQQHGSTAPSNQPSLVRGGGPFHNWLTSVYGFFGTVMQRRIEMVWKANDAYQLGRDGEIRQAMKVMPGLFKDFITYVVAPTAIEEWVTGWPTDDRRGLLQRFASAGVLGVTSSMLYMRDFAHSLVTGQDPSVGLTSSPLHDANKAVRDVMKGKAALNKQHAGKIVEDFLTVAGIITGMVPKEAAHLARFGIDVATGAAKPKTAGDVFLGATRGTIKRRVEK